MTQLYRCTLPKKLAPAFKSTRTFTEFVFSPAGDDAIFVGETVPGGLDVGQASLANVSGKLKRFGKVDNCKVVVKVFRLEQRVKEDFFNGQFLKIEKRDVFSPLTTKLISTGVSF